MTMTRVNMDEVEWARLFKATKEDVQNLNIHENPQHRVIYGRLLQLLHSLNERLIELQASDEC